MSFVGVIRQVNHLTGFGFIDCADTYAIYQRDVFIHKFLIGIDKLGALRKNEVVAFTVTLDQKGKPQANSLWNDRLDTAEAQGRLKQLAYDKYTPPYPPDLERGVNRTRRDKQMAALCSRKAQVMTLPDFQLLYVMPTDIPTISVKETGRHVPFTGHRRTMASRCSLRRASTR